MAPKEVKSIKNRIVGTWEEESEANNWIRTIYIQTLDDELQVSNIEFQEVNMESFKDADI